MPPQDYSDWEATQPLGSAPVPKKRPIIDVPPMDYSDHEAVTIDGWIVDVDIKAENKGDLKSPRWWFRLLSEAGEIAHPQPNGSDGSILTPSGFAYATPWLKNGLRRWVKIDLSAGFDESDTLIRDGEKPTATTGWEPIRD